MDIWNAVSAAAAIVAIATVAGFGLQRGRVISLSESLREAREKMAEQRIEIDELKDERLEDTKTIENLRTDIRVLRGLVTGEVQWRATVDLIEHHHERAERHWEHTTSTLDEILSTLRETA